MVEEIAPLFIVVVVFYLLFQVERMAHTERGLFGPARLVLWVVGMYVIYMAGNLYNELITFRRSLLGQLSRLFSSFSYDQPQSIEGWLLNTLEYYGEKVLKSFQSLDYEKYPLLGGR